MALYWVQFATFVVPLVTLPYTSRVLGPDGFGLVIFAQGFAFVLGLLIDFGFGVSATRNVAMARDDTTALSAIVGRVLGAKLMLAAGSLLVAIVALAAVPKLRANPDLLALAWIAALASGFNPGWFFLGIERLRLPSLIQFVSRVVSAALTFVLVQDRGDAWIVVGLYAAASVVTMVISNALMYRRIRFRVPHVRGGVAALKDAWVLFVGSGAVTLYTSLNVVLLGLFASSAQVAHFGAAERVVRAATQLIGPAATAVFPRLSYLQASAEPARARKLIGIAGAVIGGIGLASAALLALLAPVIISVVFGVEFEDSVLLLRLLAALVPLVALNTVLAGGWMISLHMDRQVVRIVLSAGLLNVALACVLTPLFGPVGMACSVLTAEAAVLLGALLAISRHRSAVPVDESTASSTRPLVPVEEATKGELRS